MEEINSENEINLSDSESDNEKCDNCYKIFNYEQLIPCEFCFQYLCEICIDKVYKNKDKFKQDIKGNYIKPNDYNCLSCNKKNYIYVHDRRKYEIYDEILNIIKTKRQNEKCKILIDELKLIDKRNN